MKIPKQLFVVAGKRGGFRDEPEYLMGFLHGYKPGDKKHETQLYWANAKRLSDINLVGAILPEILDQSLYYKVETSWDRSGPEWYKNPTTRKISPLEFQPTIWENEPLEGFEVDDFVSRIKGNKLFLVKDPRGVFFEVTVKSMETIMQQGTISKGKLIGKYQWKAGKDLIYVEG